MSIFANKTLLITGGTGSFGNAVLRRFLDSDIKEIRIFSRDEKKQDDMRHDFQARMPEVADKIKFYIGDVRDLQSVPVAVNQDKSAYEAVVTMFLEDVGTVFVLDEAGLLVGVVSRKDLLKAAINNGSDLREIPVVMVMTPLSKLIVVKQEDSVASAARKIIDNEIDCLPVIRCVGEDKRSYEVVGRITKTNFTRLLVDLAEGKGGNYHS